MPILADLSAFGGYSATLIKKLKSIIKEISALTALRLKPVDARHYLRVHRGLALPYLKSIWQPGCNC